MKKNQIAITLGIMCLILTFSIMVQLKTTQNSNSTVGQTLKENTLRDEVLKWKERYDRTYKDLTSSKKTLEEEREKAISKDETSINKQEELKKLNTYLGLTEVEGEGIIITIKDSNSIKPTDSLSNYLIHDGDLREIVNELKNVGAEAISINGQRIVNTTAITCIGNVVQINGEKVGSPFIIKAIGQPEGLIGAMTRPGSYLYLLETEYGITNETKKNDKIQIEKYEGVLTYKYLENAE